MPLKNVLLFLFEKLGHGRRTTTFGVDEVRRWDKSVFSILLEESLIQPTDSITEIKCSDCGEKACIIPVHKNYRGILTVYCTEFDDHDQQKFKEISGEPLQQWLIDTNTIAVWLKRNLPPLTVPAPRLSKINVTPFGVLETPDTTPCDLVLSIEREIAIIVNSEHTILLAELFHVDPHNSAIQLDGSLIEKHQRVVTAPPKTESPKYKKPPSAKQQVNQAENKKMYAGWRKEYQKIRKKYPNKSPHTDNWVAQEIAKLPIAKGRHKDTIRKHMIA